jgi:hypothetical protein
MAFYVVRARPKAGLIPALRVRLEKGEFKGMRPFGGSLTRSLEDARWDAKAGEAVWEEEDYCSPPLAMERAAVLDDYFDNLRVERVHEGQGWKSLQDLPSLWESLARPFSA